MIGIFKCMPHLNVTLKNKKIKITTDIHNFQLIREFNNKCDQTASL